MDISAAWYEIVGVTFSASTVADGMSTLIDYTAQAQPSAEWEELRSLDYDGDALALSGWLAGVLADEPPASDVKAYWFGVFNPVVDDEASCGFYVSGATEGYTPDTLDWACWTEGTYLPQGRYAPSQVLPALYRTAQGVEGAELLGEYTLCLGYVCLAVMAMARSLEPRLFLGGAEERPIVAGFDDGDCLLLGTVRETGWSPAAPPSQAQSGTAPFILAVRNGRVEAVNVLLDAGAEINTPDHEGDTPLMQAAERGHTQVVRLLLDRGADIHAHDTKGVTALQLAVAWGTAEMVRLLLERGANANSLSSNGNTPLMTAVWFYDIEMVKALLEHGANVDVQDEKGRTVFWWLRERLDVLGMADLLRQAGAQGENV